MNESDINHEMVLSRFIYGKELGKLLWLRRPRSDFESENKWAVWNTRYAGTSAGSLNGIGYCCINVFGKMRRSSRLTWMYHYGFWPDVIDHIDGDTAHDAIENLRNVSQLENSQNRALGKRNSTGFYGVYRSGNKFAAQINANGLRFYLGAFLTIEEAASARKEAERKFGFHPNHGRPAA